MITPDLLLEYDLIIEPLIKIPDQRSDCLPVITTITTKEVIGASAELNCRLGAVDKKFKWAPDFNFSCCPSYPIYSSVIVAAVAYS
jgi:hypothetical protein